MDWPGPLIYATALHSTPLTNEHRMVKDTRELYGADVSDMVRRKCQQAGHRWGELYIAA